MDDVVVSEDLKVVVNALDIAVQAFGQLADTVRALGHDTPKEFDATVSEQCSEITRVLEVDDVRDLLAIFPALKPIERVLAVRLFGVGRDPEHRGVVLRVTVFEKACLSFDVVHHDLLGRRVGAVGVVGGVGCVCVGLVRHG